VIKINIDEKTKILPLIKEYPSLYDDLLKLSPKIKKLKNPLIRRTLGKFATLKDVADLLDIQLDELLKIVKVSIEKAGGLKTISNSERKEQLKQLIIGLHKGEDVEKLKKKFKEITEDISSGEIGELEQELIDEGVLKPEEITKLCDLHVEIFKDALDLQEKPETIPGHPIHTYRMENKKALELISEIKKAPEDEKLKLVKELAKIDIHYTRIENQLFPILEKIGISGPPQVLWEVHDEIRGMFKSVNKSNLEELLSKVEDLIYKEENILFPMTLEKFTELDWITVRQGEEEIGYAWVKPGTEWKPITPKEIHLEETKVKKEADMLDLDVGKLTLKQINLILKHLPVDLSFIDEEDTVRYYSATKERIFPRSAGVIGRKVQKCHPPKSVHLVEEILSKFKSGEKNVAEFWIQMNGRIIHIRYFAVRDENNKYVGTLEVTQDITDLKKIEGERRLAQWHD